MTRNLIVVALLVLALSVSGAAAANTLKVGATPVPHAEILEIVAPLLEAKGITLQIVEFTDYVQPNLALHEKELDANFFQHVPYLESFNEDAGTDLVSLVGIHVEPLGVFSQKIASLDELQAKSQIAIPNDVTNGGRALLLLQEAGLISLDPEAGITPTLFDITENKLQLRFVELEAAQLSRSLIDVTAAVINGNYALQADLNPAKDAIFLEGAESPYVNVIAVRADDTENANLAKLVDALLSAEVRDFINEQYGGAVVPVF